MKTKHTYWLAMPALLATLVACAASAGGVEMRFGSDLGAQSEEDVQQMISQLQPTQRHVLSADRDLLWQASHDWLDAKFEGLSYADARKGQLETHLTSIASGGPIPVGTRVSVLIEPHDDSPGTWVLEVLALDISPSVDSLANSQRENWDWRLRGNAPDLEAEIADRILERYRLLREGVEPELPAALGS